MKKTAIYLVLSACVVSLMAGCSLEDPIAVGDRCEAAYVQLISGETVERGTDARYDYYLDYGVCPVDAPYCRTMNGEAFCSARKESCPKGTHVYDGDCEQDSPSHCGTHDNNCLDHDVYPGFLEASCTAQGKCIAESCYEGYSLVEDACQTSDQCCGDYCENCTLTEGAPICSANECVSACPGENMINCFGTCVDPNTSRTYCGATSDDCRLNICSREKNEICLNGRCDCAHGSKRCEYDICVSLSSVEHCGDCDVSCLSIEGWKTGECLDGRCVMTSCAAGYHPVEREGLMRCEADSTEVCGAQRDNCNVMFENATEIRCTGGVCDFSCADGYHKYDKACEADSLENCGEHGYPCDVGHATNRCENGACTFTCDSGFHTSERGTACTSDNLENCGGSPCDSEKIAHGEAFICNNGICEVEVCDSGYHVYNNSCEPDDLVNCGKHETACHIDNGSAECPTGTCTLTSCNSNYHAYLNTCEADSPANCGAHDSVCTITNGTPSCPAGRCVASACDSNYHIYEGACEINSTSNCGGHGRECNVANASNACSTSGECSYTCYEGFHEASGGCVKDECTNGKTKCTNSGTTGTLQVCSSGVWGNATTCSDNHSCKSDGTDCGECVDGENGCSGTTPRTCSGGAWVNGLSCGAPLNGKAICSAGSCSYVCNSGFTDNGAICCPDVSNGKITHDGLTSCSFSCNSGYHISGNTCAPDDCTNNAKRCSGRIPQTCVSGVWSGSTACSSSQICSGGSCVSCNTGTHVSGNSCEPDECSGTATKCTNTGTTGKKQTCSGGVWGAQTTCSSSNSCNSAGTDCGVCVNNTKNCSGLTPRTCTNGGWVNGTACSAPTNGSVTCSSGSCVYSCDKGYKLNGTQCVKSTSCDDTDYIFYTTPNGPEVLAYCIRNTSQLDSVRTNINNGSVYPSDNSDNAYILAKNLTISSMSSGIGTSTHPFTGVFASNGSSLVISSATTGGFGYIENAQIVNLKYTTTIETTNGVIGGVINHSKNSFIIGVTANVTISSGGGTVGGLVGSDSGSSFYACSVSSSNITSIGDVGGLIGNASGSSISTCSATVTLSATGTNYPNNAGGLIGKAYNLTMSQSDARNSSITCGSTTCGGVYGELSNAKSKIQDVNANNVTVSGKGVLGGFAGSISSSTVLHCKSSGSLLNAGDVNGGFVGKVSGSSISNSVSLTNVKGDGNTYGGFVGSSSETSYSSCGAFGDVSGYVNVGGFVGEHISTGEGIASSFAANSVSAYAEAAGFVGTSTTETFPAGNVYAFNKIFGDFSAYYFGKVPSTAYYAYYYKGDCKIGYMNPPCSGAIGDEIVLNGTEFPTTMVFSGKRMTCTLSFGTYTILVPSGVTDLVTDICSLAE